MGLDLIIALSLCVGPCPGGFPQRSLAQLGRGFWQRGESASRKGELVLLLPLLQLVPPLSLPCHLCCSTSVTLR